MADLTEACKPLWKRWLKEYVPILITQSRWRQPASPLEVADIVELTDGDRPDGLRDGHLRVAGVYVMNRSACLISWSVPNSTLLLA